MGRSFWRSESKADWPMVLTSWARSSQRAKLSREMRVDIW